MELRKFGLWNLNMNHGPSNEIVYVCGIKKIRSLDIQRQIFHLTRNGYGNFLELLSIECRLKKKSPRVIKMALKVKMERFNRHFSNLLVIEVECMRKRVSEWKKLKPNG